MTFDAVGRKGKRVSGTGAQFFFSFLQTSLLTDVIKCLMDLFFLKISTHVGVEKFALGYGIFLATPRLRSKYGFVFILEIE